MIDHEYPHRRFNPLTEEWILVSPHRTKRPWLGKNENLKDCKQPEYDPDCYLCPGNKRANGIVNEKYENTYVFNNDFPALLPNSTQPIKHTSPLIKSENVHGECRVICFSPNHSLSLPKMEYEEIENVINLWIEQSIELGEKYMWVQIFENKGEIMGCSNPHPHGQIWASNFLPNEPSKENLNQQKYFDKNNSILLLDYLKEEIKTTERIVIENDDWVVLVPYWAVWPFETMLLPKRHILRIEDIIENEKKSLAVIIKKFLGKYDNLFNVSFPYSMGWHGAPYDNQNNEHWQLHAHFYPPLLRSSTIKKFMVGYEMLAESQRDITAEQAAEKLRSV